MNNGKDGRLDFTNSDAFAPAEMKEKKCLECEAVILNINRGHNPGLLEKCKKLWEYTEFVSGIREYIKKGYTVNDAASAVISTCVKRGILVDVLTRCRMEVLEVLLTEYDEEKLMERFTLPKEEAVRYLEKHR